MTILVSGSIAFDTIIHTVSTFRQNDTNSAENDMHLSLFSPRIEKENGGTGANIAYSLALLGKSPCLIGTYWDDGGEYIKHLEHIGIDTHLSEQKLGNFSAQAFIIRDEKTGQINTFHAGAMSLSWELTHKKESFSHAIVAPDSKEGMLRRVDECVEDGIFTIFDPGQAMGIFSREELLHGVKKAHMTAMNEPERIQFEKMTGSDFVKICEENGKIALLTLWEKGSMIYNSDGENQISVVPPKNIVDATGCGDAYRAGLLFWLSEGWDIIESAELCSILASIKISHIWGQNHHLSKEEINALSEKHFGKVFFA